MDTTELVARVVTDADVCGGMPRIRGTRLPIAVILDGLGEGLTPEQIVDHFPYLGIEDIRAAAVYAAELARERVWRIAAVP